jgi:hypothetical protein
LTGFHLFGESLEAASSDPTANAVDRMRRKRIGR